MGLHRTFEFECQSNGQSPFDNNLKRTINCPVTRANMNEPSTQSRAVEPGLKFRAPAPAPGIYIFWLRFQPLKVFGSVSRTIGSSKN